MLLLFLKDEMPIFYHFEYEYIMYYFLKWIWNEFGAWAICSCCNFVNKCAGFLVK